MATREIKTIRQWADLDELALSQRPGRRQILFGLAATFVIEGVPREDAARRAFEVADDYLAVHGDKVTHRLPLWSRTYTRITGPEAVLREREEIASPEEQATGFRLLGKASDRPEDLESASHFLVSASLPREPGQRCTVTCFLPGSELDRQGAVALVERVLHWSSVLRPTSGTFGLSLLPEFGASDPFQTPMAYPYLARHPGLDWPDVGLWAVRAWMTGGPYLRTVYWLTLADDRVLARKGGRDRIVAGLGTGVSPMDYPGGVIFRAGLEPQLGDMNLGQVPDAYRAVSAALSGLAFTEFKPKYGLFRVPPPLMPGEAARDWVRRFD